MYFTYSPFNLAVLLLALLLATVNTLALGPAQGLSSNTTALFLPSSNADPNLATNQTSVSSDFTSPTFTVNCSGDDFGRDLNVADCASAISYINDVPTQARFGRRTDAHQNFDIGLPSRQIGDQGLCTIQLLLKPQHSTALASPFAIHQAATTIFDICVNSPLRGDNNLQVAIAPYDPKDVHCGNIGPPGSTVPPIYSCKNVVDNMPTSKDLEAFGKMGSTPQPEVTLPAYKVCTIALDRACVLVVGTFGPTDTTSWYEIWEAAVAISGMCVCNGNVGAARGLGRYENIFIGIYTPGDITSAENMTLLESMA
ncbi:hypothetical protein MMC28_001497 [Mycoblastus sanguinarius]|nr:hypothetical protein [Mycoblastus sanguinarius]